MEDKKNKKLGKQKVYNHNNGKIKVGTTNKKDCRAAYVRLETWVTVEESVETSIQAIRRRFIANLNRLSNIYFEGLKTHIIDYDYNQTKGKDKSNKTSFISIEITLIPKTKFEFDNDFEFAGFNFGDTLFSLLDTLDEHFIMTPSKK
jgi:hypothetical protein